MVVIVLLSASDKLIEVYKIGLLNISQHLLSAASENQLSLRQTRGHDITRAEITFLHHARKGYVVNKLKF